MLRKSCTERQQPFGFQISCTEKRSDIRNYKATKGQHKTSNKNRSILPHIHKARRTESLEKLIDEGKINGKHPRGRAPTRWEDQVRKSTRRSLHEVSLAGQDRERWRIRIGASET